MKKVILLITIVVVVALIGFIYSGLDNSPYDIPVPLPDHNAATSTNPMIHVSSPASGQILSSPVTIKGEARGAWFFEASFPIKLVGQDGQVIAQTIATAQGDWMTEGFVPFSAVLTIPGRDQDTSNQVHPAKLEFHRDNPSGLPENDDSYIVDVYL